MPSGEICDGVDNDCDELLDDEILVACSSDADCGAGELIWETFCGKDANVNKLWKGFRCVDSGTCSSACELIEEERVVETCMLGCAWMLWLRFLRDNKPVPWLGLIREVDA
ncbi:MAG: hypothetical protein ABIH34_01305 [Nanoarchaeota archaeon]